MTHPVQLRTFWSASSVIVMALAISTFLGWLLWAGIHSAGVL